MPGRLEKGSEHLQADGIINEALKKGDLTALDKIEEHEHPSVSGRFLSYIFDTIKQHPSLARGTEAIAVVLTIAGVGVLLHERSVRKAQEKFAQILKDPLAPDKTPYSKDPKLNLKKVFQAGETAIDAGLGEQFVTNLFASSVHHPSEAEEFWKNLNPYHPIFKELLEPEPKEEEKRGRFRLPMRDPRHLNPKIQPKYDVLIKEMTEKLNSLDLKYGLNPPLGNEINLAIQEKLKIRHNK